MLIILITIPFILTVVGVVYGFYSARKTQNDMTRQNPDNSLLFLYLGFRWMVMMAIVGFVAGCILNSLIVSYWLGTKL